MYTISAAKASATKGLDGYTSAAKAARSGTDIRRLLLWPFPYLFQVWLGDGRGLRISRNCRLEEVPRIGLSGMLPDSRLLFLFE